jgi:hypothetical protein
MRRDLSCYNKALPCENEPMTNQIYLERTSTYEGTQGEKQKWSITS